jgi:hypothetical protein
VITQEMTFRGRGEPPYKNQKLHFLGDRNHENFKIHLSHGFFSSDCRCHAFFCRI